MPNPAAARRHFLLGIFVVSGFTGLIYESIWSHYLKLFLGHAAYAQTLVLAIFMGGMALGAWLVARYSTRLRHLLWGYLLVEALIGVCGMLFHRLFVAATDLSFATIIPALPAGLAINIYKWSLAALLVLPQSVLLGMTFPLISGGIIRRWPERAGETVSILYFTNSLGGALGVLVSGFVLIGLVGLPGTILTAGLLNLGLALAVWLVVRHQAEPASPPAAAAPAPAGPHLSVDPVARWFVIAAFLTGAASFLYELGWIRMLSQVLGSSTHSFELMLSAFIFGLAFGGLYVRKRIERIADPERYLGTLMLTMGVLAALTVPAGNLMYDLMAWALRAFARSDGGYLAFNTLSQSIAMLIMFPATFCAGMTLPVLTHALMRGGAGEKAIGAIYSANTLGAIAGVLLAVHVLLPWIGVKGVILSGAAIHIALGLSRLAVRGWRQPATGLAIATSVAAFALIAVFGGLDPQRLVSGVYRSGLARLPAANKVIYLRDGQTATITLQEYAGRVTIATNGKPDAGIQMGPGEAAQDEPTMVLAAAISLSLNPGATRVANIGFGSGLTTHTLLASPQLQHLDTIEIEPAMVEGARLGFGARIHNVFEDPRSHVVYEDAKTFFAASHEPYDLIVSEPSNPWVSGVASLFSDEFYGRVVQYLRPDGCLVQWMQIYETDTAVVASVLKALSRHFGAYAIYNTNDQDILIVATRAAALPAPSDQPLQWPGMRAELERVGVQSLTDLQSRWIGDNRTLGPLINALPVPANSDFFPFVDLNAPRLRFLGATALQLTGLTSLPIPVLDLLRDDAPSGTTLEPSTHSTLARDQQVRRALALRGALSSARLDGLDSVGAVTVLLLRTGAAQCADPQVQAAWKTAARNVGASTASYLSPAELADVWSSIRATPCYRDVSGPHKVWADLLAAVAARNAAEIVPLGTRLLETSSSLSREERTYLTTVIAAGYARLGQLPQARDVLTEQWDRLDHGGELALSLTELRALAQSGDQPALAHSQPTGPGTPGT
jgi:predicted membrane-bound spermidine synthase